MKNKKIIIGVVSAIALGIAGFIWYKKKNKKATEEDTNMAAPPIPTPMEAPSTPSETPETLLENIKSELKSVRTDIRNFFFGDGFYGNDNKRVEAITKEVIKDYMRSSMFPMTFKEANKLFETSNNSAGSLASSPIGGSLGISMTTTSIVPMKNGALSKINAIEDTNLITLSEHLKKALIFLTWAIQKNYKYVIQIDYSLHGNTKLGDKPKEEPKPKPNTNANANMVSNNNG